MNEETNIKKAIILLSGGLDSAVCAAIAKSEGYDLIGLTFNYGQSNVKEIEFAKKVAEILEFKEHIIFNIEDLKKLSPSALTSESIDIQEGNPDCESTPNTYVPGRNIIFLSLASGLCESVEASKIYVGFNQLDYTGYPDCRDEFVKAMQDAINKGTVFTTDKGNTIEIVAPLISMSKKEIIMKGKSLNLNFDNTWSCYTSKDEPCMKCDACLLRQKGFQEAKETKIFSSKEFTKVYFVTGNKHKVAIFNKVMAPEFQVECFKPKAEIPELETKSVQKVVIDKLDKTLQHFSHPHGYLFVTDVGLFINQLNGHPGALIKRDTKRLFNGDFQKWCNHLDSLKQREVYIQMIIAAKNKEGKRILIDHKVKGHIPVKPQPGKFGFGWDDIFVPDESYVSLEYKGKSFAQIPKEVKFNILMIPPINEFKRRLLE
ncbi:MAG: 7-cyano-7-deazaguanine synthase QueC [Armatimonadetes bacterium]|nr:7-cyano-7-deazaguanine synthase QueC [Armatimonadota bacterium]